MALSVFDLFSVGIGPSSSHTVGPMIAANRFIAELDAGAIDQLEQLRITLYGSLAATGRGHGTGKAIVLGLQGEKPETVDTDMASTRFENIKTEKFLNLAGGHRLSFDPQKDLVYDKRASLPAHPNGMRFEALGESQDTLSERIFYSVGGGFVLEQNKGGDLVIEEDNTPLPYPFTTAVELLEQCKQNDFSISELMLQNELAWRDEEEIRERLLAIWHVMQACVEKGCNSRGVLPGLKIERRAPGLKQKLLARGEKALGDPLSILDWVNLYALAVNEENAAGGRIVTAPTNGAAGIIPAVMHYYERFCPGASEDGLIRFLLTAGAIGILFKRNASISGAEVGCQGEVGSACSMAAGGLTEALGGTAEQVENAAEIAMEHNLGLTCDPIGGLVQIPCIERNAMASIKAINATRLALQGDGQHFVSLDKVIKTMRDTGRDMRDKYKETSRGGLATNVLEIPVNFVDC